MNRMSSGGVDLPFRVGDGTRPESPDDVDEAVGLPEAVEERGVLDLAEGGAREVGELRDDGDLLLLGIEARDGVEPRIGKRPGADARFLLPIPAGFGPRPGSREQAEQGRFPGPRIPEQDEVHEFSKARTRPAVKT